MWIKIFIVLCLLAVVINLFFALRAMSRNAPGDREKMARYLTIRVAISIFLLLGLGLAMWMGWLQPHGVHPPALP